MLKEIDINNFCDKKICDENNVVMKKKCVIKKKKIMKRKEINYLIITITIRILL